MAELRHNYETVLSWLQPAGITATGDSFRQEDRRWSPVPELPELPSTQDRKPGHQSVLVFAPDLSALPSTEPRSSPIFTVEMLNSLIPRGEMLERHKPSPTLIVRWLESFVDEMLDSRVTSKEVLERHGSTFLFVGRWLGNLV